MRLNVKSVIISRNLIFVNNNNNRTRLEVVEQGRDASRSEVLVVRQDGGPWGGAH